MTKLIASTCIALNLGVLDGWWPERYEGETGWVIARPDADVVVQDDHDTAALYDLLEPEVVPLFYSATTMGCRATESGASRRRCSG